MRTHRRAVHTWMALLVAAALLAACGDASNDGVGAGEETAETASESGAPGEEPRRGGTIVVPQVSDGDTLDPHTSAYAAVHGRVGLASSRLLRPDLTGDHGFGEAPLTGDLAESWEVADDGLTYTFHLRDDVVWHDIPPVSGRPFVADDVVATFERIQAEGFQAYMLEHVTSVEAPDDHTVVLTLSQPFAPLLNYMGNHHMWIMPREGVEGEYDVATQVIGTGPFMLTTWDRNVETVYEANPTYFEPGIPYVDSVRMPVVSDQGARIAAFRAGEAHLLSGIGPEETEALLAGVPDAVRIQDIGTSPVMMFVNMERAPFDDVDVRRAISMAVDREGLGESLFGAGRYSGPVNSHLGSYSLPDDELRELIPYDPDQARQTLADAGFPDGFETTLMVSSGYGQGYVNAAEWVASDLADIGIDVEIEVVDQATYSSRRPAVQYDMGVGPSTPFQEPDEWLRAQYHIDGSRNWWNISDPALDDMLDEQAGTVDADARRDQILDIQRYILEDVVNPMHLWAADGQTILRPNVRDYSAQPQYGWGHFAYLWLDQ